MGTDGYTWQARLYDRALEPMNAPLRRVSRRLVTPPPQGVVLDVGCGTGAALAEYRETGCHVLGADPSRAMLAQARERLGEEADLRLMHGSAVPFEDACADLVLLSLVLHSLTPRQARGLLDEAARVLTPDGRLLVTDFGTHGLRFPRGWATRAVTVLAEVAAGPTHASHAVVFVQGGGVQGLLGPAWATVQEKHTAGGNITLTVLSRT